jgi:propionyl-CoA carboxylase alpha chain
MFQKLLIANRGEIACRIIRTARRMGIATVAVYSEADTNALHVSLADEAIYIGPSAASESYLSMSRLLEAIQTSGSDAVHPGYGFLSENSQFAKALEQEGVTLIGPSSDSIKSMGDKIQAKKIAHQAGVSTVPGYMGVIKDAQEAVKIATKIGFPVIIKATAGGGGKGMRIVHSKSEIAQAFSSAVNEATNSFKDGRIFIEKFIETPRHIEIQVIADRFGNVVCLGERECSIQRHHQKVIEEAPSSFIDAKTRQLMYRQCTSLVKKVGYYSAGTVEFIVDAKKNFYFLEMNTRLQVEHPVTEYVTGLDLVELMIRVAAGEKLPLAQKDVKLNGWSMESRIYAEDPSRGFLPSSGRISEYREPAATSNVRVDTGVYEGGEVSMFYDAMIAKLITYGKDRKEAIAQMQGALGDFVIHGISHNISFLEAVMGNQRFAKGDISTNFIAEEYPDGFSGAELTSDTTKVFLSSAAQMFLDDVNRAASIKGQLPGRRRQIGNRWVINVDGQNYPVYVRPREGGSDIKYDKEFLAVRSNWVLGSRLFQGKLNGRAISVRVEHFAGGYYLTHAGSRAKVMVRTPRVAELGKFMPERSMENNRRELRAPISGMVVEVKVKVGDVVKKGKDLLIIEAMKMENVISAQADAEVKAVHVEKGQTVAYEQVVVEFV